MYNPPPPHPCLPCWNARKPLCHLARQPSYALCSGLSYLLFILGCSLPARGPTVALCRPLGATTLRCGSLYGAPLLTRRQERPVARASGVHQAWRAIGAAAASLAAWLGCRACVKGPACFTQARVPAACQPEKPMGGQSYCPSHPSHSTQSAWAPGQQAQWPSCLKCSTAGQDAQQQQDCAAQRQQPHDKQGKRAADSLHSGVFMVTAGERVKRLRRADGAQALQQLHPSAARQPHPGNACPKKPCTRLPQPVQQPPKLDSPTACREPAPKPSPPVSPSRGSWPHAVHMLQTAANRSCSKRCLLRGPEPQLRPVGALPAAAGQSATPCLGQSFCGLATAHQVPSSGRAAAAGSCASPQGSSLAQCLLTEVSSDEAPLLSRPAESQRPQPVLHFSCPALHWEGVFALGRHCSGPASSLDRSNKLQLAKLDQQPSACLQSQLSRAVNRDHVGEDCQGCSRLLGASCYGALHAKQQQPQRQRASTFGAAPDSSRRGQQRTRQGLCVRLCKQCLQQGVTRLLQDPRGVRLCKPCLQHMARAAAANISGCRAGLA